MRKILLTFAAFVVAMAASAQTNFGSFEPVSASYELNNIKTTVAADGSVYVTSTYDQAFAFAGAEVAAPDFTSPCIVKYNAAGAEQWVVTFAGAAEIFDIAADIDGTLYAAGRFAAEVVCKGANGAETTISGDETMYTAFIAKIGAAGEIEVVKTVAPVISTSILDSFMYFPEPGGAYVTPSKIQIDGDKVYVSASFTADVPELGWVATYLNVFDFMYMENQNYGVFSLDKSDLSNIASIATVKDTDDITYVGYKAEAFSFAADNGKVYLGFFGYGNLTLTTAAGTQDFVFDLTEEGSTEHAFVFAEIGATTTVKEFRVAKNDKFYIPFSLFMEVVGEEIVIAGTYFGEFPFDTSIATEEATALFVAKLAKDGTVKEADSFGAAYTPAACMGATEDAVIISADEATYTYADGAVEKSEGVYSDICGNTVFVHADETKVCIDVKGSTVGIEDVVVENDSEVIYNLLGQPVDASYQGVVIKGGKLYIVK